ncbi:MAG: hypothetical protein ILO36_00355 [Abditibacteriota bacterium]|nr:hypothetical protein [Abditibacteriota bacterium]
MKKATLYFVFLMVFVLPLCGHSYSVVVSGVPEYLNKYVSDSDVYYSFAVEYGDAVIIEKTVRKNQEENKSISFDSKKLKETVGKAGWTGVDKSKGSRETVYKTFTKDGKTFVVALLSPFKKQPWIRSERVVVDEIRAEKANGKTVIIRYILPPEFMQSENTGHKTPVPVSVSFAAPDVLRLEYEGGAKEHWRIMPDAAYLQKNKEKYGTADRMLIWSNGAGRFAPFGDMDSAKAWDFVPNASREPVYKNQTDSALPETTVSAVREGFFAGMS